MKRKSLTLMFMLLLSGCGGFSAAARAQKKRAAAEETALKSRLERSMSGYQRALKGKIWSSVAPYYYDEDLDAFKVLKQRTEKLWKRGQLLDLQLEVRSVDREAGDTVAHVRWQRSLLERGAIQKEEGKCEISFRKSELGDYQISGVSKDAFF